MPAGANKNDDKEDWLDKNEAKQDKQVEKAKQDNPQQEAEAQKRLAPAEEDTGFSISKLIPSIKKD